VLSRDREDGARDPDEVIAFRFLPLSSSGEFLSLFRNRLGRRLGGDLCSVFVENFILQENGNPNGNALFGLLLFLLLREGVSEYLRKHSRPLVVCDETVVEFRV
jgi:hypothetical protein